MVRYVEEDLKIAASLDERPRGCALRGTKDSYSLGVSGGQGVGFVVLAYPRQCQMGLSLPSVDIDLP